MKPKILLFLFFGTLCSLYSQKQLRFQHSDGSRYRILSTINEDVIINGQYSHHSKITNKASVSVSPGGAEGSGQLDASFYLTEEFKIGNEVLNALNRSYHSNLIRDRFGAYSKDSDDYMPVVRDVPRFPERAVRPGESWVSQGYEVHDFRADPISIPAPYRFPILVNYTYEGEEIIKGRKLDKIRINYNVFHNDRSHYSTEQTVPRRISGSSNQTLYWDNETGRPHSYREQFQLVIKLSDGFEIEFKGTASAVVLESEKMDRTRLRDEIENRLEREGLKKFEVVETEKGVSLTLNNINFYADSSRMLPGETEKLNRISEILKEYKDRDIMVIGHTARAGTEESQKSLSVQRAAAVADHLIHNGTREAERIIIEGRGASEPVADNSTEAGKRKNRRVEIQILEN